MMIRPLPRISYRNEIKIRIAHPKILAIAIIAVSILLSLTFAHADDLVSPWPAHGPGGEKIFHT